MANPTPEELYGTGGAQPIWKVEETRHEITPDMLYGEDTEPGFLETELGQTAGGIAGGIAGAQRGFAMTPPVHPAAKPIGGILGGAIGAFGGGGIGETGQQAYQALTDSPYAPENLSESMQRVFEAGGEEALYDLVGSTLFKGIGLAWKAVRPKPTKGIEEIQQVLGTHGGRLSAAQMTDNSIIQTIEGLSEAAWGGRRLRELRAMNDEAIKRYTGEYVSSIADQATRDLTDEGLGRLFINTVEGGRSAHSVTAEAMYSGLDDLFRTQTRRIPRYTEKATGLVDEAGKPITRVETKLVTQRVKPVGTGKIKRVTKQIMDIQEEIGGATLGDYGGTVIKKIDSMGDSITFRAAQELRSGLLANIRTLEGQVGEANTKRVFGLMSDAIDESIEIAAKKSKNPELIESWRQANNFWKKGKTLMNNEFISKLMNKNPEAIGDTVFSIGNVTQIKEARRALRAAAKYTKGTPDEVSFSKTWKRMQKGYLQNLIGKVSDPQTGELSIRKLRSHFVKGTPQNRTLNNAFTKEQRNSLEFFVKAAETAQKRPEGAGTFMVTVGQAGLVLAAVGAVGGEVFGMEEIPTKELATFTLSPMVMARLLTNPKTARLIARGINMKTGGQQAGAVLAKIMAAASDIGED